jgi:hypothetical protein
MSKTTLEEWLIQHITKHPNITFGSLYRDACLTSKVRFNSHDNSLHTTIDKCKSMGLIIETKKHNQTYFNISKQLDRENKINQLLYE